MASEKFAQLVDGRLTGITLLRIFFGAPKPLEVFASKQGSRQYRANRIEEIGPACSFVFA